MTPTPYGVMGSSPIRLRVIHEHGSGKADQTYPWPSVLELRVLITLEPETVEHLLSSRPQSSASPSAITHHDLDLSIHFPFIIPFVPRFIPIICTNTINPRPWVCRYSVPPYSHPESNCSSPGQAFFRPYLFITLCSHTACLVCQRALFLTLLSWTLAAQPG